MKLQTPTKELALILSALIALSGFIAWLTTIQVNGKANSVSITSIEEKIDRVAEDMNKVKTDVALIKQAVGAGRETASAGTTNP